MKQHLYKVSFTISDDYHPKVEGVTSINIVVLADSQFTALSIAWDKISCLGLDEPSSFSASRVSKC